MRELLAKDPALAAPGNGWGFSKSDMDAATGWTVCVMSDNTVIAYPEDRPPPSAELLVARAQAGLELDGPEIITSPPRGSTQLVSVPVWFWAANTHPVSTTASITGLSATLTAEPVGLRIEITGGTGHATEDHVTLRCPRTGTPFSSRRHRAFARSDCSHAFDWNDTYTIHATVDWALAWTATNGQNGTLPTQHRTTTFTLTIQQAQAVTD